MTRPTLLVLAAIGLTLSGCGGSSGTDPEEIFVGTWEGTAAEQPDIGADPLVGTWRGPFPVATDGPTDELTVGFEEDGAFQWTEVLVYPSAAATFAGCTETTTWSGTYATSTDQTMLTLTSTFGETTRAGCASGADDGTSTPSPLTSTVDYFAGFGGGGSLSGPSYHFQLFGATSADGQTADVLLSRIDRESDASTLTFGADGSFEATEVVVHAADSFRFAGCTETRTRAGSYVIADDGMGLTVTLDATATILRESCAGAADDGTSMREMVVIVPAGFCAYASGPSNLPSGEPCDFFFNESAGRLDLTIEDQFGFSFETHL